MRLMQQFSAKICSGKRANWADRISTVIILILALGLLVPVYSQIPWTKDVNNPVLTGGGDGTWNKHVFSPHVLYNPDSTRFEMWFGASAGFGTGSPADPSAWRPYRVGYATSPDGINWSVHPNAVLIPDQGSWDETTVEGAMVIWEDGQYKMWYTGWSPSDPNGGIGYAISPDGINWTKYENNPVMRPGTDAWEEGGPGLCTVIFTGNAFIEKNHDTGELYQMFYTGYDKNFTPKNIGHATSADGIVWERDTLNNPIFTISEGNNWDDRMIYGPKVIYPLENNSWLNVEYHMWYTGISQSSNSSRVGWATSEHGITWNKYNDTTTTESSSDPVLIPSPGQWDGSLIEAGSVVLVDETFHMWYSGQRFPSASNQWSIGHATAPNDSLTRIKERFLPFTPQDFVLHQNYPNPFNPSTTIEFTLPKSEFVELKVYCILGTEVSILVSNKLNAGNHTYTFDGNNLASGIYYYQLVAGEYKEVKKMILLK